MKKHDFIPKPDETFNDWQKNFVKKVALKIAVWLILAADFTVLTDLQTDWDAKWLVGNPEADPNSTQTKAKTTSRNNYDKGIRKFVKKWITGNDLITDGDRIDIGVTVRDTTRTPSAKPDHAPAGRIEKNEHLRQVLRITDPANPSTRQKPDGVKQIRVYRFVGTQQPANASAYSLYGNATKFRQPVEFTEDDEGKKAFYILQYENTRGETGPMSAPFSGPII